jgi:hypothetical protein
VTRRLLSASLSDRVVGEDRCRLIGLGTEDGEAFVSSSLALGELGRGQPETSIVRAIAVRGDDLVAASGQSQYVDGTAIDILIVVQFRPPEWLLERIVLFDLDATEELDRLHSANLNDPDEQPAIADHLNSHRH